VADGTTIDTFSESGLTPGDVYTVSTTLGTLVTADADSRYVGTQVIVGSNGTLSFQVQRPSSAGVATVLAQQVEGKAWASTTVTYQARTGSSASSLNSVELGSMVATAASDGNGGSDSLTDDANSRRINDAALLALLDE
jgi:hypothetical protein